MRRQSGSNDPVQVARRIAAALNAPQSIPALSWGFAWATGLTVDGTVVVANTYGLGYIPEKVNLPDHVRMVTADESIAPSERAKWAAYPFLALQGWAQLSNTRLQAVFGTEEQLKGIDPGARKVYLDAADIPEDGTMRGRNRLEVIAPGPAAQLKGIGDAALADLLPPDPVDDTPPEDNSEKLWFDMIKPLMRSGRGRESAHLEAFVAYANESEQLALHRAQTADAAPAQRAAIADWVYWQHLGVLVSDALSVPASP